MAIREYIDVNRGPDRSTLFDGYQTRFDGPLALLPVFVGTLNADLEGGNKRKAEEVEFSAEIAVCNHIDSSGLRFLLTIVVRGGRFDGRVVSFVYDTDSKTARIELVSY